ncbi:MAG: hypothetical protein IIA85_02410 [Nanoarchaeota archaeon]|nr:hypothetical protein [Nanoarchaeota archaeon]
MKKTIIVLGILIVFGFIIGGIFLFNSISSVDVIKQDFVETLEPIISYSHCHHTPGYPNDCDPL